MNYSFLLMRHAQSRHNKQKAQWKQRYHGKSYKKLPEYKLSTKFSPDFIDSKQVDLEQCLQVRQQHIDLDKVALVICSPLRRCLETCKQITQGHTGFSIVVEPMLTSRLSAAWSIGSSALALQQEYPTFDFSALSDNPERWMFSLMSHCQTLDPEQISEMNESMQQFFLSLLTKGFEESYAKFYQRTRELKKRLASIISKNIHTSQTPQGENKRTQIIIIAHSCVLSFLLGKELNEKGKVKDKISFEHCTPQRFTAEQVLQSSLVHPGL